MNRLVSGVGINDDSRATTYFDGSRYIQCPFYMAWHGMLSRCYNPSVQAKNKSYIGCSVAPEWLVFSKFKQWMISKEWDGNQLDKDLLTQGNKVYGPRECAFISQSLNKFTIDRVNERGDMPLGVSLCKRKNKFRADCNNPFTGKKETIGRFNTPEEAHNAWRHRKHQLAMVYADMQSDQRVADALRVRYA